MFWLLEFKDTKLFQRNISLIQRKLITFNLSNEKKIWTTSSDELFWFTLIIFLERSYFQLSFRIKTKSWQVIETSMKDLGSWIRHRSKSTSFFRWVSDTWQRRLGKKFLRTKSVTAREGVQEKLKIAWCTIRTLPMRNFRWKFFVWTLKTVCLAKFSINQSLSCGTCVNKQIVLIKFLTFHKLSVEPQFFGDTFIEFLVTFLENDRIVCHALTLKVSNLWWPMLKKITFRQKVWQGERDSV